MYLENNYKLSNMVCRVKFYLFSKIEFEIPDPISSIEYYCYQNDFYSRYDVIENRKIEDVNKIGARF